MSLEEDVRLRMGLSVAALMDMTDEQVAEALREGAQASRRMNDRLSELGVPVRLRLTMLTATALAPIVEEIE